jgi:hypothetical protein
LALEAIAGEFSGLRAHHLTQSARDADGSSLEKKTKRRVYGYSEASQKDDESLPSLL